MMRPPTTVAGWTARPTRPEPPPDRVDAAALDLADVLVHCNLRGTTEDELGWHLNSVFMYLTSTWRNSPQASRWAIFRLWQVGDITITGCSGEDRVPWLCATPKLWERWRAKSSVTTDAKEAERRKAQEESEQRPAYGRDHYWMKQYNDQKPPPGKKHSLVAILRSWNALTDEQRVAICPGCPDRISDDESGRMIIKEGIRKARNESRSS